MATRPKLLVVDDDLDMLEICREILQRLPAQPEIQTASTGPRALALLEAEPFTALITDLSMPTMDGLQVLAAVRRKWPRLRTVVITSTTDEQLRRRAHGIGVDLFCEKPRTAKEIEAFLAALDALLKEEAKAAARPAHERSLSEILHLECLARNTSVIKCAHGGEEGRVWIRQGEIIDAATGDLGGEAAMDKVFSWQGAKCELLPGEPSRPRRIHGVRRPAPRAGGQRQPGLADDLKEMPAWRTLGAPLAEPELAPAPPRAPSSLAELTRTEGVELALSVQPGKPEPRVESWGVEHPEELAQWMSHTLQLLAALGETLQAGNLTRLEALTSANRLVLAPKGEAGLCLGFGRDVAPEQARESLKSILSQWAS
jgi:CheY-like chemotaxis protein